MVFTCPGNAFLREFALSPFLVPGVFGHQLHGGSPMASVTNIRQGKNYAAGEAGPMEALDEKLFIGKALGFSGMEVSLKVSPST